CVYVAACNTIELYTLSLHDALPIFEAFILIYFIYRLNVLGIFALTASLILIAFGSMFPREINPLIPALQSDWLFIHVSTTATGQAILSISFVSGLINILNSMVSEGKYKS